MQQLVAATLLLVPNLERLTRQPLNTISLTGNMPRHQSKALGLRLLG